MVGKQGVAAPVSSRFVCQPCFICQLLHHCVNASLLLYRQVIHTRSSSRLVAAVTTAGVCGR
jgi:hypothetical protein